jgi:thioredoxin-like negative regulator of GroEL
MPRIIVKSFIASKDAISAMQVSFLKEIENIFRGRVEFEYLNANENESQASKYRIKEIPTIIIEFDGKERERFVGLTQQLFLKKAIQKNLSECR